MTPFEILYVCLEPFLPPLYRTVRRRLHHITRANYGPALSILDVGGRKSPYTLGLPARVIITDLPRKSALQQKLHLGLERTMVRQLRARRSNVSAVMFDDMTRSALADACVNCVVSVEVLEHVEQDDQFLREVWRVLKPGGLFLGTTPNGDWIPNASGNPDHKRHYTRDQLRARLVEHFAPVEVEYAIRGGTFHLLGLRSWSVRAPGRTLLGMISNVINLVQSASAELRNQPHDTVHLIALARKRV